MRGGLKAGAELVAELELLRARMSQVEQRLRATAPSEDSFEDFTLHAPVGIYRTTPDGRILMANPVLVAMLGYERFEDLAARNLEEGGFEPQYPRSGFREQIERDGFVRGLESIWIRRDGRPIHVIEYARAVRDGAGQTLFYEGTALDVTEHVTATNDMRSLMDAAMDEVFLMDRDGTILAANEMLAREFGIAREKLVGMSAYDLIPPDLARQRRARIEEVFRSGQPVQFRDVRAGKTFLHSLRPVFDATGKVVRVAIHGSDLTEMAELEQYRAKMARTEHLASVGVLSAMLYHDLKRPLTVINLSIEEALAHVDDKDGGPQVRQSLERSLRASTELEQMARSLLARARCPRSGHRPARVDATINETVRPMVEMACRAGLTVEVGNLRRLPVVDMGEDELAQVCFCLLENAMQAANGMGDRTLKITGRTRHKQVELAFADDCGGVVPEHVDRMFEPFFTTKADGQGTGLGLAVVKSIVEGVEGKVWAESRYGEGTTFFVRLPVSAKEKS